MLNGIKVLNWPRASSFVKVLSTRKTKAKTTSETRFYLTSIPADRLLDIAASIRSHWSIENSCHWRLDAVFNEDSTRSRTGFGPENLAIFRRLALSALNHYGRLTRQKQMTMKARMNLAVVAEIVETFLRNEPKQPKNSTHFA